MDLAEQLKAVKKVSVFIEAYDFEVINIVRVAELFAKYRPVLYIIIGVYLLSVYFGQKWMKNRPAYKLTTALLLWNIGLAVFSIVATVRGMPEGLYILSQKDGIYLSMCSRENTNYATIFWAMMFVVSKVVELGDTAFIVLRKQKLIVLHWFHHVATLYVCWLGLEYMETGGRFFWINTFVHSFMYSYYALKGLKVKIPKKISQALTLLQISQMILLVVLSSSYFSKGEGKPCPINAEVVGLYAVIVTIFTVLFINFFVHTYWLKPAPKSKTT